MEPLWGLVSAGDVREFAPMQRTLVATFSLYSEVAVVYPLPEGVLLVGY